MKILEEEHQLITHLLDNAVCRNGIDWTLLSQKIVLRRETAHTLKPDEGNIDSIRPGTPSIAV